MVRSELDKLLAVTKTRGGTGSRTGFTKLMAEVLKLSRTPKAAAPAVSAAPRIAQAKTVQPEATLSAQLLKAAPVTPSAPVSFTAPVSLSAPGAPASDTSDLGRLASQVTELRRSMTPTPTPVAVKTGASSTGTTSNTSSTIVKVISQVLGGSGLGSIVTGIAGLFGGGKPEAPEPLYQFSLPQSVSVEAGVTRRGQFVPVSYSQSGLARPNETPQPVAQVSPQPMVVDTRWFMDHSEDIASAVKEAMLHSHSINDVVADL